MHIGNLVISDRIIRFFVSGGTGATTLLIILYILHELLHLWYLAASTIAFIIAVIVSFFMQKFWSFQDRTTDALRRQFSLFALVALFNMGANATLMYGLTDIAGIWYLFSQVITSLTIAIWSFFIYKHHIFIGPRLSAQAGVVENPSLHEQA